MLRLLYKTLLISVMSGSLSIMNMTAFALDTSATAQMSKATQSDYTRNADGSLTKTESNHFTGTQSDSAINVITMLAVGVIGTKLLMYKKWTLDMTVVAAASAAYIASEIMNIMNLKKQLKDMDVQVTKNNNGQVDQTQIETLQKLKASYQEVKKSAQTKKQLQMAAGAAFVGATAIAAYQRWSEEGKFASCEAGIASAETSLQACITAGAAAAATAVAVEEASFCSVCAAAVTDLSGSLIAMRANSEVPAPTVTKAISVVPEQVKNKVSAAAPCGGVTAAGIKSSMVTPSCTVYLAENAIDTAFGTPFMEVVNNHSEISGLEKLLFASNAIPAKMSIDPSIGHRNLLQKMIDSIFPKAEAGMLSMLGLGAGAAAAFFTAKTTIGTTIDTYMFTPGGRIIAWGIMSAAAFLGASSTQQEINKIDGNIAKIDQILKDLNTLQSGVKSNNVSEQQIQLAAAPANQAQDLQLNPNASVKTDCLTSLGSDNCKPLADQVKSMPGFSGLPQSFQSIASQAAKLGDGLSGTNTVSGSTLSAAGTLAANSNAIKKLADSAKNKLNETLAKNGKAKIDFDKEEKKLLNQLNGQTAKALSGKGMSAGAFLSSAGLSPFANAKAAIAAIPTSKKVNTGSSNVIGTAGTVAPAKDKAFELNLKESPNDAAGFTAAGAAAAKDEKFDIGSNDINSNNGESIFQVISNRYIKSGYPKLLDEIPAVK